MKGLWNKHLYIQQYVHIQLQSNLKMQKEIQLKTTEFKELQETIIELRAELEKTNGR